MFRSLLLSFAALTVLHAAEPLPVTGIAHAAFKVSDMAKARQFYEGVLGYKEAFSLKGPDSVFFQVNDDQFIQLIPGLQTGEDVRFSHVAFATTDIRKLQKMLEARGLKPEPARKSKDGNPYLKLKDLEGNALEFVQITSQSLQAKSRGKNQTGRISDRMYHVGIQTANLDTAMAFYRDKLGFEEFWRGGPENQDPVWFNMRTPGERGDYIELMLHPGNPTRDRLGSMQHICLQVPDIQAAKKLAFERGDYDESKTQPRIGRNRKWQLNLFDPDGTRTELMEPNPQPQ